MFRSKLARLLSVLALAGTPLSGCGGDSGTEPAPPKQQPPAVASVTLSPGADTVEVGSTQQFSATVKDAAGNVLSGRTLTWSSSNTSVATVENGLVRGVAKGAVTITATTEGKSGSAPVTVMLPAVASVSIGSVPGTLLTGDTVHLTATPRSASGTVLTEPEATWTTSDATVAAVSPSGIVQAVGPGTATITARSGEHSATAQFTVFRGSGMRVPEMAVYDSIIPRLMEEWKIPGGSVAVVKDGRLVFARGYGLADVEAGAEIEPNDLFRIASVSKPITSAAILKLVEEGRLSLEAKAFELLNDLQPPAGATVDPRLAQITVRHLLYHAGGWDRDATFDPMFRSYEAAEVVGAPAPASAETVIRYMMGQPLQFDPGTRYAYSNFGYAILGEIIERVTGQSYEEYVKANILAPAGITRMRIGRTQLSERVPGEVRYYDPATKQSVFPGEGTVPRPYGGFYLEPMAAHGGWIASAPDLLRFVTAVDERSDRPDVLQKTTIDLMVSRPAAPLWEGSSSYYGMGWSVRPTAGDANWWHTGSLPGTTGLVVRTASGMAWAALFNARAGNNTSSFTAELDAALWEAAGAVSQWPTHDLFPQHP